MALPNRLLPDFAHFSSKCGKHFDSKHFHSKTFSTQNFELKFCFMSAKFHLKFSFCSITPVLLLEKLQFEHLATAL